MFTRKSSAPAPASEIENERAQAEASDVPVKVGQAPSLPKMPPISQPGSQAGAGTRIPQRPAAPHIPGATPPQASAPSVGSAPRPPEPPRPAASTSVARPAPTQVDEQETTNADLRRMPEPTPMPNPNMPTADMYSSQQSAAGAYRAPASSHVSLSESSADAGRLIVGKDIELKGEVKNCDLLVVEGTVEAVLVNTRALEVTADGVFRGTAPVATAEVSGLVEGDLIVEGHVFVRSTGIVNGNIEFGELEIERGGRVRGSMTQFGEASPAKKTSAAKASKAKS